MSHMSYVFSYIRNKFHMSKWHMWYIGRFEIHTWNQKKCACGLIKCSALCRCLKEWRGVYTTTRDLRWYIIGVQRWPWCCSDDMEVQLAVLFIISRVIHLQFRKSRYTYRPLLVRDVSVLASTCVTCDVWIKFPMGLCLFLSSVFI